MTRAVKPVPEGFHTITPHLVVRGAAKAIDFYKRAFGAEEQFRSAGPDGQSIMHATLKIGDSLLHLCDEFPGSGCTPRAPQTLGGTPVTIHLRLEDADAVYNRAIAAGAQALMPMMDAFWGDRYGQLTDPFGHVWSLSTRKEDLTPAQVEQRAKEFFAQMAGSH